MKRKEVLPHILALAVNQPGVVGYQQTVLQQLQAGTYLLRQPQVVLIGKEDVLAPGLTKRILKVVYKTVSLVVKQADAGIAQTRQQ